MRNLKWSEGQTNPSGAGSRIFAMRKSQISEWPDFKDMPATIAEEVGYDGDFVMNVGEFATEIYSTQGETKLETEVVGEKDCKGFNNKLTGNYPDINDEAVAWANNNVNANSIFVAQHFTAGGAPRWVVIGGQHYDPEVSIKADSGAKMGEKKGLAIEATAGDSKMLPRYTGVITLENGVYDCATNKFTAKP